MPDRARVFRRKGSKCWYCYVPKPGGGVRPVTTHCTDRRAAEARAAELERLAVDPSYAAATEATVARICGDYIAHLRRQKRADETVSFNEKKLGHVLRLLVDEGVGPEGKRRTYPMAQEIAIRGDEVLCAYVDARQAEGVMNTTVLKELRAFGAAWKQARKKRIVSCSVDEIMPTLDDDHKDRKRALTPLELVGLATVLPRHRMAVVAYAVAGGVDYSALWRALPEDAAADRSQVRVRGSKRATRDRIVPLPLPEQRSLLDWALANADGAIGGRLFSAWPNIRHDLANACERLGIARVSPNDLRRTYAKWCRTTGGIEPALVGPAMGHRDGRMVERVYGALTPSELADLMGRRALAAGVSGESHMRADAVETDEHASTDAAVGNDESSQKLDETPVRGDGIEPPTRGFSNRADALQTSSNGTFLADDCRPNESAQAPGIAEASASEEADEPPVGGGSHDHGRPWAIPVSAVLAASQSSPASRDALRGPLSLGRVLDVLGTAWASVYGGRHPVGGLAEGARS